MFAFTLFGAQFYKIHLRKFILLLVVLLLLASSFSVQVKAQDATFDLPAEPMEQEEACVLSVLNSQGDKASIGGGSGEITTDQTKVNTSGGELPPSSLAGEIKAHTDDEIEATNIPEQPGNVLLLVVDDFPDGFPEQNNDPTHGTYVWEVIAKAHQQIGIARNKITLDFVDYSPENTFDVAVARTNSKVAQLLADGNSYDAIVLNKSWVILRCVGELPSKQDTFLIDLGIEPELDVPIHVNVPFYSEVAQNAHLIQSCENPEIEIQEQDVPLQELLCANLQSYMSDYAPAGLSYQDVVLPKLKQVAEDGGLTLAEFVFVTGGIYADEYLQIVNRALIFYIYRYKVAFADDNDWIRQLEEESGLPVFSVAAAGNYNQYFQSQVEFLLPLDSDDAEPGRLDAFEPARWESVFSVGGVLVDNPSSIWKDSHDGQVVAPAAWHMLQSGEFISGTSFAAPLTSVLISFVLTTDGCGISDFQSGLLGFDKNANVHYIEAILNTANLAGCEFPEES